MKPQEKNTNINTERNNPDHKIPYLILIFPVIMASLFTFSCDKNAVFDKNTAIQHHLWNYKDTLSYYVNIADTSRVHNIYLNIRNSENYQYSNVFLFVSTYAPNGSFLKDTFEIKLADQSGRWFGKGVGNVFSLQVPYKMQIKFPYQGIYLFEIQHAMRKKDLKGIADVGLRVEKAR
ncbi:MAG TPA: gliding motility lipoprotein GldH [Bacteroidales bacterium]|nr:gliding motility lipoprotein GldH [Bacteroidales bacterium]